MKIKILSLIMSLCLLTTIIQIPVFAASDSVTLPASFECSFEEAAAVEGFCASGTPLTLDEAQSEGVELCSANEDNIYKLPDSNFGINIEERLGVSAKYGDVLVTEADVYLDCYSDSEHTQASQSYGMSLSKSEAKGNALWKLLSGNKLGSQTANTTGTDVFGEDFKWYSIKTVLHIVASNKSYEYVYVKGADEDESAYRIYKMYHHVDADKNAELVEQYDFNGVGSNGNVTASTAVYVTFYNLSNAHANYIDNFKMTLYSSSLHSEISDSVSADDVATVLSAYSDMQLYGFKTPFNSLNNLRSAYVSKKIFESKSEYATNEDVVNAYEGFCADDFSDYGLTVSGEESIKLVYGQDKSSEVYTAFDLLGASIPVKWSTMHDYEGVSIDADTGVLTVLSEAADGDYVICADALDESLGLKQATKTVQVCRGTYKLVISGEKQLGITSQAGASAGYTASVIDAETNETVFTPDAAKVEWNISPLTSDIALDKGRITVPPSFTGVYTLNAKYDGMHAEYEISFELTTYTIEGSSNVKKPLSKMITSVSYTLTDSFGNNIDDVTWECNDAEMLPDGRLLLTPDTPGAITVNAHYNGNTVSKSVTVNSGIYEDYEIYNVGDFLNSSTQYGEIKYSTDTASQYISLPISDSSHRMYKALEMEGTGFGKELSLSFDCFAEPGQSFAFPVLAVSGGTWVSSSKYACAENGNTYTFTVPAYASNNAITNLTAEADADKDRWINVIICFDTVDNNFDFYLDGIKKLENVTWKDYASTDFSMKNIILCGNIDNIMTYSGLPYKRTVTYTGSGSMSVSSSGSSEKILTSEVYDEFGITDGMDVTWSITGVGDDFTGDVSDVYISGNRLCTDKQVYGMVKLVGSIDGGTVTTGEVNIKLQKSFSSFDGKKITVNAAPSEKFEIKIYNPSKGNYIDSVLSYDPDSFSSYTVSADENGIAVFDGADIEANGMYCITITSETGTEDSFIHVENGDILLQLDDADELLAYALAEQYLVLHVKEDVQTLSECMDIYRSFEQPQKAAVLKFTEKSFDKLCPAILLVSLLSGNKQIADSCKEALTFCDMDASTVDLLVSHERYNEIADAALKESNLSSALDVIKEKVILFGVEGAKLYYREAKQYLALLGNKTFDKASESTKNKIAEAVAGKKYSSTDALNRAINSVDTDSGGSGSGAGSGSGSSGRPGGVVNTNVSAPDNATDIQPGFKDVDRNHWAYQYIEVLASKNIINGYNGLFNPDDYVTRAEFTKLLSYAFYVSDDNSDYFDDVRSDSWYYGCIGGCAKEGLVLGDAGKFRPNDTITRQDAAVMLHRFAVYKNIFLTHGTPGFSDNAEISDYAADAVGALYESSIINGVGENRFAPLSNTTRAEAAKLIYVLMARGGMI